MTPGNIVGMAAIKELDVIAVTDHNTCKNCPAVLKLAKEYGILAIPGMELTTMEEVHVVCLIPELEAAMDFDAYVYERLMDFKNNEEIFGKQQLCNEEDQVIGKVDKLLINATDIAFEEVYDLVQRFGGIMIPAHIDKNANSLLSNLGFVPPDSRFSCVELKNIQNLHKIKSENPYVEGCHIISNSDAHYLADINEPEYRIYVKEKTSAGVLRALMKL